jgi:glycosyltransferase involved in cell wall biosynthesis
MVVCQRERVAMLLENNPYPQDVRVRSEAESLVRAGHAVTVIAPRGVKQPSQERIDGVNVIRFRQIDGSSRGRGGFLLEYLVAGAALHYLALRELLRGATVLHLHNPPDIMFPVGALYRLAGRKVIFDHHDLFPETIEVKFGSGLVAKLASRIAAWCQRLTYAVANRAIATNESYAEVARRSGAEVTVVRNAAPRAWTELPSTRRAGVLDKVRVAYLGSISSQDGVDGLAPVLARLGNGLGPLDVRLTVIGDGDARPDLERALARRGLSDKVTFTGRVAPHLVPELIQDVDVCVDPAPSTDVNERSTMTKIGEYLALGKPVVAYDLLETRRTSGDAAMLVARDDTDAFARAIATLARDPALRARLADQARSRARESLTWEHSERALLEAYNALRRS